METTVDEIGVARSDAAERLEKLVAEIRAPDLSEPTLVLAIDIGTSSVRGALYNSRGDEVGGTQIRFDNRGCITGDDAARFDAMLLVEQVAQVIDAVLDRSLSYSEQIVGVAVSCFWHSLMAVDSREMPASPVFGWADNASFRQADELRNAIGETETHSRTGCRFHPSYWPAKLSWFRDQWPEKFGSISRWLGFADFLFLRLFGEACTSVSMASGTGLFDQRACDWDDRLLENLSIARAQLPTIADSKRMFTALTKEFSLRWRQLKNVPWLAPVADGAANNIGAGCVDSSRIALMIGTSAAMRIAGADTPADRLPSGLWSYRVDRQRTIVGGALSDGGGLFEWLMRSLAFGVRAPRIEFELSKMPPDAHGLTVLPFWSGERSTGWQPLVRGGILGLSMGTRPIEILRASMEAVAYQLAGLYELLQPIAPGAEIVASGGALWNSPTWVQIIADVLGRKVWLADLREASSRGAALLALEALGKLQSISDCPAPPGKVFDPDMERHERYRAGLRRQHESYERVVRPLSSNKDTFC